MITLSHGEWTLTVRPELGAAVTRLTWRGLDILRPTPDTATGPLETASFPLVPYANRIEHAGFVFQGQDIAVRPTPGFEPHALHGVGWLRAWTVVDTGPDFIDLMLSATPDGDWPWDWSATHRLRLDDRGLETNLSLTNRDEAPIPAGLGLHPYFATDDQTVATLSADSVWLTDATGIPRSLAPAADLVDWRSGVRTADAPFVDNAYAGWSGVAELRHSTHIVTLTAASNARWVQVYAPGGDDFVCIEPVTHRPNAHNAPSGEDAGLVILAPGDTLSTSMRITAAPNGKAP